MTSCVITWRKTFMGSAEMDAGGQHDLPLGYKRRGYEVNVAHPVCNQEAMRSACQSERETQQRGIDLPRPLQRLDVDCEVDQRVERANGADIACLGSLDAQVFGLAIDAFAGRALAVDALVERTLAIKRHGASGHLLPG